MALEEIDAGAVVRAGRIFGGDGDERGEEGGHFVFAALQPRKKSGGSRADAGGINVHGEMLGREESGAKRHIGAGQHADGWRWDGGRWAAESGGRREWLRHGGGYGYNSHEGGLDAQRKRGGTEEQP